MGIIQTLAQKSRRLCEIIIYFILQNLSTLTLIQIYMYFRFDENQSTVLQTTLAELIRKNTTHIEIPYRLPYRDLIRIFSKGSVKHIKFTLHTLDIWKYEKYDSIPMRKVTIQGKMDEINIDTEKVNNLKLEDIMDLSPHEEYLKRFTNLSSLKIKNCDFDFLNGQFITAKLETLKIKQCWICEPKQALIELIKSHSTTLKNLYIYNQLPDNILKELDNGYFPKLSKLTISLQSPIHINEIQFMKRRSIKHLCVIVEQTNNALELTYQLLKTANRLKTFIIEISDIKQINTEFIDTMTHIKNNNYFTKKIQIRASKYQYIVNI